MRVLSFTPHNNCGSSLQPGKLSREKLTRSRVRIWTQGSLIPAQFLKISFRPQPKPSVPAICLYRPPTCVVWPPALDLCFPLTLSTCSSLKDLLALRSCFDLFLSFSFLYTSHSAPSFPQSLDFLYLQPEMRDDSATFLPGATGLWWAGWPVCPLQHGNHPLLIQPSFIYSTPILTCLGNTK